MAWQYEIISGKLFAPDGSLAETGYAGGFCGQVPEAVNNPAFIQVKNTGPLPPGWYTMGDPEQHTQLGPNAIPLTPDPANEMYGRSGFYMHGDSIDSPGKGSDGCVVQPALTRLKVIDSDDKRLQVVIQLPVSTAVDPEIGQ